MVGLAAQAEGTCARQGYLAARLHSQATSGAMRVQIWLYHRDMSACRHA